MLYKIYILFLVNMVGFYSYTYAEDLYIDNSNIITYQYRYTSILVLDSSVDDTIKKNWYALYRQQVNACMKDFEYPEDFNASVSTAQLEYRQSCHYKTIVDMNNFENNLYFDQKKEDYNVYKTNPLLSSLLEDSLSCDDCSLYPNKNSEVQYIQTSLVPEKKVRVFMMNSIQKSIFTAIFNQIQDNTRQVVSSSDIIISWIEKINKAKHRSDLKNILDDFVNHIEFQPIETEKEIQAIGEKIYLGS